MRRRPPAESQRGSITVLTAALMFLAGVLTLAAVDLLRAVQARAVAQTAADAAALAAAQEIAIPSGKTPQDVAAEYAGRNHAAMLSCTCEPGSSEAVVEVEASVDLVFVGADRTVRAAARAVIEGAKSDGESTMTANVGSQTTSIGGLEGLAERQRPGSLASPSRARSRRLHAGQASPASRVAPRRSLPPGDLRRASRAPPGGPVPRRGCQPALPGV
jgi:Flp pilus assembly protein TadG